MEQMEIDKFLLKSGRRKEYIEQTERTVFKINENINELEGKIAALEEKYLQLDRGSDERLAVSIEKQILERKVCAKKQVIKHLSELPEDF